MGDEIHSAIDFYNRHPITAGIVLAKLQEARGHLDDLKPDELLAHDQDHYGGTGATDALARARASPISAPGSGLRRATSRIATAPTSRASS